MYAVSTSVSSSPNCRTDRLDECHYGPSEGAGNDVQLSSKSRARLYGVDTPEKRDPCRGDGLVQEVGGGPGRIETTVE